MRTDKQWRPTDNQLPHDDFHYRDPHGRQPMQIMPLEPPKPEVDWQAFREQMSDIGRTLNDGITQIAQAWREAMAPLGAYLQDALELLGTVLRQVSEIAWTAYEEAGAPYGETSDGLLRWLREESEATRLRVQAETIEQQHRDLAQLRQWGKDMRARREAGEDDARDAEEHANA